MQRQNIIIKRFYHVLVLSFSLMFVSQFLLSCATFDKILNKKSDSTYQVKQSETLSPATTGTSSSIHVIDANTFRVDESYDIIWDAILTVLMRNYNIMFVSYESGIITTDWDSFYLKEHSIRNKVTVKIKKLSFKNTEIIFRNSVEKLSVTSSYNWIPTPDKYGEVTRIINNVAILLNQPPVKISQQTEGSTRKVFTR